MKYLKLLVKTTSRENCFFFQEHNRITRTGFEPRPRRSFCHQYGALNYYRGFPNVCPGPLIGKRQIEKIRRKPYKRPGGFIFPVPKQLHMHTKPTHLSIILAPYKCPPKISAHGGLKTRRFSGKPR